MSGVGVDGKGKDKGKGKGKSVTRLTYSSNDDEPVRALSFAPRRTRSASPMPVPAPIRRRPWTHYEEHALAATRAQAHVYRLWHYRTAMYYRQMDNYISLPAYLLQILTAGSALSALQQQSDARLSMWLAGLATLLSITTLMLKGVSDYKKFAKQERDHKEASEGFSELAREITRELHKLDEERQSSVDFTLAVDDKYAKLKKTTDTIPQHIIDEYNAAQEGRPHRSCCGSWCWSCWSCCAVRGSSYGWRNYGGHDESKSSEAVYAVYAGGSPPRPKSPKTLPGAKDTDTDSGAGAGAGAGARAGAGAGAGAGACASASERVPTPSLSTAVGVFPSSSHVLSSSNGSSVAATEDDDAAPTLVVDRHVRRAPPHPSLHPPSHPPLYPAEHEHTASDASLATNSATSSGPAPAAGRGARGFGFVAGDDADLDRAAIARGISERTTPALDTATLHAPGVAPGVALVVAANNTLRHALDSVRHARKVSASDTARSSKDAVILEVAPAPTQSPPPPPPSPAPLLLMP